MVEKYGEKNSWEGIEEKGEEVSRRRVNMNKRGLNGDIQELNMDHY